LPGSGHNPVGGVGEGGGLSLSHLILITWPQAVRQMRSVRRGKVEGGGGGRHDAGGGGGGGGVLFLLVFLSAVYPAGVR
jgi:hypothetical protein